MLAFLQMVDSSSSRAEEWFKSVLDEWQGLAEMGVLDHNFTLQQCRDLGIKSSPVPITMVYDHKYGENGELTKLKTRAAVRGTPKYMQKGVHYNETFVATPSANATKILMGLVAHLGLYQLCWDITKAYCWSPLKHDELLILEYPKHFERYDPETGEQTKSANPTRKVEK